MINFIFYGFLEFFAESQESKVSSEICITNYLIYLLVYLIAMRNAIALRGYLKSFFILNFAPLAPQLWGE
ncbi:hypothetical protein BJP37_10395 [Moorena bouillonii PNG]|uniref:Uncharacterized protein n=1 Tax=Moorena bouillonii PNG TaxID=568701 RepID=A0A1U7N0G6_9CYAN|nr:hypothetical protein BJP37_10395 [Moorena bouillonii PNG]